MLRCLQGVSGRARVPQICLSLEHVILLLTALGSKQLGQTELPLTLTLAAPRAACLPSLPPATRLAAPLPPFIQT